MAELTIGNQVKAMHVSATAGPRNETELEARGGPARRESAAAAVVITVVSSEASGPLLPGAGETSDETQRLADREVRRLVDEAGTEVTELLTEHRDQLERLNQAPLAAETLDAIDACAATGVDLGTPAHA